MVYCSPFLVPHSFRSGRCNKHWKFTLELRDGFCKLKKGLDKSWMNVVLVIFQSRGKAREFIRSFHCFFFDVFLAVRIQWRTDAFWWSINFSLNIIIAVIIHSGTEMTLWLFLLPQCWISCRTVEPMKKIHNDLSLIPGLLYKKYKPMWYLYSSLYSSPLSFPGW